MGLFALRCNEQSVSEETGKLEICETGREFVTGDAQVSEFV